jgi:hypothetical protein
MKKGNIIDLRAYRKRVKESTTRVKPGVSKELQQAIKQLIQRMRKGGPMRRSKIN